MSESKLESEKKRPREIRERAEEFALRAIRLYEFLETSKSGAAKIIANQFLRSATSVGANLQEAKFGESKADFVHKLSIAQKEANETLY